MRTNLYDDVPARPASREIAERRLDGYDLEIGAQIPSVPWAWVWANRFWQIDMDGETVGTHDRVSLRLTPLAPLEIETGAETDADVPPGSPGSGGACRSATEASLEGAVIQGGWPRGPHGLSVHAVPVAPVGQCRCWAAMDVRQGTKDRFRRESRRKCFERLAITAMETSSPQSGPSSSTATATTLQA